MTGQPLSIATLKELETQIKHDLSRGSRMIQVRCDDGEAVPVGQLCHIELSEDFDIHLPAPVT
jgi:hypothetical protein